MLEEETVLAEETARAMRELARTVTAAPPLRLAPRQGARAPRLAGPRRWTLWAVPLTAAVAVIALAVALVTIRDLPNGRVVPPAATGSPSTADVPKYYVSPEEPSRLVVGETLTGTRLATFSPSPGTKFEAVSAAADDRTFVVDSVQFPFGVPTQHVTWYLLTITPGSSAHARLTRLPIPATLTDAFIGTMALSASGRELAVTYQVRSATLPYTTVLRIYSVATGKLLHSWSTDQRLLLGPFGGVPYVQSNNQLSWVDDDRALSFATSSYIGNPLAPSAVGVAVRTLDVTASGADLIRDSRVVWSMRTPATDAPCAGDSLNVPWLTTNGKTVVCSYLTGGPKNILGSGKTRYSWHLAWLAYRLSAQKAVARTLYKFTAYSYLGNSISVQWADASGSTVIVAWSIASATSLVTHFGVVTHGKLIPLPSPPVIRLDSPPDIAW